MKRKIFSFFLAINMFICGILFTVVNSVVCFAVGAAVVDALIPVVSEMFTISFEKLLNEIEIPNQSELVDMATFRKQLEIAYFHAPLLKVMSNDDVKLFFMYNVAHDYQGLENHFGHELRQYCEDNSENIDKDIDIIVAWFGSIADFCDFFKSYGPGVEKNENGDLKVPSDLFKEELQKQNRTFVPKNRDVVKYSWRELSDEYENYDILNMARNVAVNHKFLGDTGYSSGIYIEFYAQFAGNDFSPPKSGSRAYYSPFQYHVYMESETVDDSFQCFDGSSYPHNKYNWYIDYIYFLNLGGDRFTLDHVLALSLEDKFDKSSEKYTPAFGTMSSINLGLSVSGSIAHLSPSFNFYSNSLNAYKNSPRFDSIYPFNSALPSDLASDFFSLNPNYFLLSTDTSFVYSDRDVGSFFGYQRTLTDYQAALSSYGKIDNGFCDYGILISREPFTTTYMFDITRLPSDSTVTLKGDTVYDYSITDNSTGNTSTIYNYVTNDYTYPENSGNDTSGSVSGGGNITVGGKVDVGGKVEIDVNLHGGGNGVSYDMPDLSPIDDYLNSALDESSGVRSFLAEFFSFLPPQILTLLGIGLTVVILSRILGR